MLFQYRTYWVLNHICIVMKQVKFGMSQSNKKKRTHPLGCITCIVHTVWITIIISFSQYLNISADPVLLRRWWRPGSVDGPVSDRYS